MLPMGMGLELQNAFRLGITSSETLFKFLEDKALKILEQDEKILEEFRALCGTIQSRPSSPHWPTFGKTAESFLTQNGHGEESSLLGMLKEVQIARHLDFCSLGTLSRVTRCISQYGFQTRIQGDWNGSHVIDPSAMSRIVLIRRIGQFEIAAVSGSFFRHVLEPGVCVIPSGPIFGTLRVPGSKSISNRVLLLAALGEGSCEIEGLLDSDDIHAMLGALSLLGVKFKWTGVGDRLRVFGSGGKFESPGQELYLGNSGTSARFLTSAVTLVSNSSSGEGKGFPAVTELTTLTGNPRMKERPIGPLVTALRSNGCSIDYEEAEGCLPIRIGNTGLRGGKFELEGKVSSQYVSSILMVGPYAAHPLTLQLAEKSPVSLPYILMTLELMKDFGIPAEFDGVNQFRVPRGTFVNPAQWAVEPDASSATYLLAMAAVTGGEIRVLHLGSRSLQGDAQFFQVLEAMGCEVFQNERETRVRGIQGQRLRSVQLNMETLTDAFMTIAVLAAVAEGRTEIRGIANQRVKECNRIQVMVEELTKIGVGCGELPDGLWIDGIRDLADFKTPAFINCHDDHRIALSFGVLGSKVPGIIITDKDCTAKTYPGFWDDCRSLGVRLCAGSLAANPKTNPSRSSSPVFLVGMRGCGKSSFGKLGAAALGFSFICMDQVLEAQFGTSISSFVTRFGWPAFRDEEEQLLRRIIGNMPADTIVSCGGGIVESPACVELLCACPVVVHLRRSLEELKCVLDQDQTRPTLRDDLDVTLSRRLPLFQKLSGFQFQVSLDPESQWERPTAEFVQFLQKILQSSPI